MSQRSTLTYPSADGRQTIQAVEWLPEGEPRGVIQIVHGIAEHIDRYRPFMEFLADNGFVAAGNDHLGHGKSIRVPEEQGFFAGELTPFEAGKKRHFPRHEEPESVQASDIKWEGEV